LERRTDEERGKRVKQKETQKKKKQKGKIVLKTETHRENNILRGPERERMKERRETETQTKRKNHRSAKAAPCAQSPHS